MEEIISGIVRKDNAGNEHFLTVERTKGQE